MSPPRFEIAALFLDVDGAIASADEHKKSNAYACVKVVSREIRALGASLRVFLVVTKLWADSTSPGRYLSSLEWDGGRRTKALLVAMSVEPSPGAVKTLGAFLKFAQLRARLPGAVGPCGIALFGAQGTRKSAFVRALFGARFEGAGWYAERQGPDDRQAPPGAPVIVLTTNEPYDGAYPVLEVRAPIDLTAVSALRDQVWAEAVRS